MNAAVLHDLKLAVGEWWACSAPERPGDGSAVFDERCPACQLKAHAEIARLGDHAVINVEDGRVATMAALAEGGLERGCTLDQLRRGLALAREATQR